jgi:DNA-binding response OmpR family regulator
VTPSRERHHATILLVDDDITSLDTYARFLEVEGYAVRKAPDAATAIMEAEMHRPDAVVLDLRLPDQTTGLSVLRQFRSHVDPPLPVGIVTGDYGLDPDIEREIRSLGASLTFKPIWLDEMLAVVEGLLARLPNRPTSSLIHSPPITRSLGYVNEVLDSLSC